MALILLTWELLISDMVDVNVFFYTAIITTLSRKTKENCVANFGRYYIEKENRLITR